MHVSVGLKGDVSAKLSYRSPCFIVDLGYNFYGIMKEHINLFHAKKKSSMASRVPKVYAVLEYATVGTQPPVSLDR